MLVRYVFSAVLAIFALPVCAAEPEPPAVLFSRYDLLGTWASDCKARPGPANWFVMHSATANGGVKIEYDHGALPLLSIVDSAEPLTGIRLGMHVRYADEGWGATNGAIYKMIVEVDAKRMRTVQSIRNDGTILIKDSKFATDGRLSQILYKCSGGSNA
jgi:hypothetical protein